MQARRHELVRLLEKHRPTAGMYVRVHGEHLVIGRTENFGPKSEPVADDRVRLTSLGASRYGLSVKRHTGRWERTPFSGDMTEMVDTILEYMQHLVAPYG